MRIGIASPFTIRPFLPFFDRKNIPCQVPTGSGGTPVVYLVTELLRRGQEVVVFTLDPSVENECVLRGSQLVIRVGPYRPSGRARDFFRQERRFLYHAITKEKPDIIHANWTYEYALAALETGFPTLVTAHDAPLNVLKYDRSPYRMVRTAMAYAVARKAAIMTGISPHIAEHWKRWMFFRGEMHLVPNGLPDPLFAPESERRPEKEEVTFGSVLNGWGRLKNGATLLRAFSIVRRRIPTARLVMYGSGYGKDESASFWAVKKGLTNGVTFAGKLPQDDLLLALKRDVDVLVHPSREEANPMAVIEAMALGLPVIGGKTSGGVPFTLGNGAAGVLTDINSPASLARAMLTLAADARTRQILGTKARHSARTRFSLKTVTDHYESLYRSVK